MPSQYPRLLQFALHTLPTLFRRCLGSGSAPPVGFKANRVLVAVGFESLELSYPIDNAFTHGRPVVAVTFADYVLAMAVADSILRQECVTIGIGILATRSRIARIPVQHKASRVHRAHGAGSLGPCGGIACRFVFQQQDDTGLTSRFRCMLQLLIHFGAIRPLVIEAPKIKAANAIGAEDLSELNTSLEHISLLQ